MLMNREGNLSGSASSPSSRSRPRVNFLFSAEPLSHWSRPGATWGMPDRDRRGPGGTPRALD